MELGGDLHGRPFAYERRVRRGLGGGSSPHAPSGRTLAAGPLPGIASPACDNGCGVGRPEPPPQKYGRGAGKALHHSRYRSPGSWGGRPERHHRDGRSADERRSDEQRDAFARAVGAVAVEGPTTSTSPRRPSSCCSDWRRRWCRPRAARRYLNGPRRLPALHVVGRPWGDPAGCRVSSCVSLSGAAAMPA